MKFRKTVLNVVVRFFRKKIYFKINKKKSLLKKSLTHL